MATKTKTPAFVAVRLHRFKGDANGSAVEAERTEYAATAKGARWTIDPKKAHRFATQAEAQAVSAPFHGYTGRAI